MKIDTDSLKTAYSQFNYYTFLKVLDLRDDYYAEGLWYNFTHGMQTLFKLSDETLVKLAKAASKQDATVNNK